VSREHLTRLFLKHIGFAPQEFMLWQRLYRAGHLIKETGLSVKEVAARTGFATPAAFVRAFKRVHGITPGRFRIEGTLTLGRIR